MKKRIMALALVTMLMLPLAACVIIEDGDASEAPSNVPMPELTAEPTDLPEQASEEPENKPTISMTEFVAISTGMTYEEVVDIIGSEGELLSEVNLGTGEQYKTSVYMWKGEGSLGANANITFQGGTVIAKAQIGLE